MMVLRRRIRATWHSLWPLLLVLGACRPQTPAAPDLLQDVVERGPLRLTVAAGPRNPAVGDVISVTVAVETPEDFLVALPTVQDFGELPARLTDTPDPRPGATGLVWRRSFEIDALVSGPVKVPALTARYGRRSDPAESQPVLDSELVSNALKLDVSSALTDKDRPEQPRDITGALLPPKPPMPLWMRITLAAGTAVLLVGVWRAYRALRRWLLRPAPPILPEVWALRALADLAGGDWFERGRMREYYYRLTEVVRSYIERKFGLAAPEMTTEEFLAVLARDRRAVPYDAARLRQFLEACDIVKYAAWEPRREDAEAGLATARAFVHATAAAQPRAADPARDTGGPPA